MTEVPNKIWDPWGTHSLSVTCFLPNTIIFLNVEKTLFYFYFFLMLCRLINVFFTGTLSCPFVTNVQTCPGRDGSSYQSWSTVLQEQRKVRIIGECLLSEGPGNLQPALHADTLIAAIDRGLETTQ